MQDRRRMLEFAVLADRGGLAVTVRFCAVDAQRRDGLLREQLAEFLADGDQGREVLDVAAGERIFDSRRSPPRAGSAATRLAHFQRVSSTTVTILRMIALIVFRLVFESFSMHQPFRRACRRRRAHSSQPSFRGHQDRFAMQAQCGAVDQPRAATCAHKPHRLRAPPRSSRPTIADAAGDKPRAEVAVGLQIIAPDTGGWRDGRADRLHWR
jgi:hypothetical protein